MPPTKKPAKKPAQKTTAPAYVRPKDGAFWLMKSEPDAYSIDDLARDKETGWEGVRNYQARNFMRDHMRVDDAVLFYHSNATPPGIVGLAKVSSTPLADPSQFDSTSHYYDADSSPDDPRWMMVKIAYVNTFSSPLSLDDLKNDAALDGMPLLQRGQRLSVQPVSRAHFRHILKRAGARVID